MAKYLDETGLRTLWTKIKGTFVAKTIKKSDSSNATQITHDGDTVSLSRGTISGTGNTSTYTKQSSIDIIGNNIVFTALNRPSFKTSSDGTPVNLVLKSDLIIAGINDLGLVKSTTTGKTANRDYYVEVDPKYGTMKVNVPWTDNNTTYSIATSSTPGLVKLGNDTVQSTAANSVTNTSSRTYAIQKNSNNQLVVNVPWTDTKTTIDTALSSTSTNPVQNKVINAALSTANTNISTNATNIGHLQGYFDNGKAIYAINDANSNPIITTYATKGELGGKANASDFNTFKNLKGQKNGLAELDSNGKVPSSQLPSYVDDVIEGYYYNSKFYKENSHKTEITGESGKIYTDLGNNKTYRWSGTAYTEISASLALGETSSTAYPGDKGKANATNITTLKGYFNSSGIANKAAADASGHNIVDTYATKSALSATNSNVSTNTSNITTLKGYFNSSGVANKAAADGNGNNIANTYANKSALSATNSNVSTNTTNITTLKGYFNSSGVAKKAIADEDGNPIKTSYVKISETNATGVYSSYIKNLGNEIQLYTAKDNTTYSAISVYQETGIFIRAGNHHFNFENGGDFYYSNIDDDNIYLFLNQKNHTPITNDEINTICQ
ncbi:MAG: hypothetical protein PUJ51_24850 [Clostridiales bacterium]|nr:hypothetical protein [Clostridiales bacterium]